MDSICSFSTESLKFLTVIPDVIRTSQADILTCHSNSVLFRQLWKEQKLLGKQGIKLNITITQSDPNNYMAYKDLQSFEINIMF